MLFGDRFVRTPDLAASARDGADGADGFCADGDEPPAGRAGRQVWRRLPLRRPLPNILCSRALPYANNWPPCADELRLRIEMGATTLRFSLPPGP